MTIVGTSIDVWSDMDMYCPADYYNGFKEGRLLSAGDAERALSDWFTGDWTGSTFRFTVSDYDARIRRQLASQSERYWVKPLAVRLTSREVRARRGRPYTAFVGPIVDAQPASPLGWDVTIGDAVSNGLLSDALEIPWRRIRDGFLSQLDAVSERLDLDQPEPILYGSHTRNPAASPQTEDPVAARVRPIYLGIWNIGGFDRHVWMVCGHATSYLDAYLDGFQVGEDFGPWATGHWWLPHQAEHHAQFGAPYVDLASDTYGNDRRYTLIFGRVGFEPADDAASGARTLTVAVDGIEDVGDSSGVLILDRFQQYKHFLINYVAHQGIDSYQSGVWLTNPTYELIDREVPVVDEDSFDTATDIGIERLPGNSPYFGYVGAAAIGMRPGDRSSARRWIADWNRSCGCRFGVTHLGQLRIVLLHPTDEARADAPLFTDSYEIDQGTFGTSVRWDLQGTSIPYRADQDLATGQWLTSGAEGDEEAQDRYQRDIAAQVRDYPFAPNVEQARHLAILESRIRAHPPRLIRFEVPAIEDPVTGDCLAYRDIGDHIRYVHFDAVTATAGEERLAQIVRHQVRASQRTVYVEALDCEDYIGYDQDGSPGGSWGGSP